jgi:phage repressor protein C with HTH and peptisase S24 domain
MIIMDETNKRLLQARIAAGFESASAAAKRFGWPVSTYNSHENGQTSPVPRNKTKKYARAFKVKEAYLLGIDDQINERQSKTGTHAKNLVGEASNLEFDLTTTVPEIDIRAGESYVGGYNQEENIIDEGGNSVLRDSVRANWGIPVPFLRNELHIRPGRAHILPVRGDSMMDALFDGDRAIVDLDDCDISQGGIFALLDDNQGLIIKQVEIVRGSKGSKIRCTSRNQSYSPFELALAEPVRIVGRIAGKITRL